MVPPPDILPANLYHGHRKERGENAGKRTHCAHHLRTGKLYPQDLCSLQYRIPHELLIAVRLSAQCTDARVNQVVPALFAKYPSIEAFAEADVADVEEMVRSCGLYHTKARDIVEMCKMLRDEYGGVVPDSIEELTRLPRRRPQNSQSHLW